MILCGRRDFASAFIDDKRQCIYQIN